MDARAGPGNAHLGGTRRAAPDRTRPRPAATGPARCRARHLRPPARTGLRIRSTHHLVTPSVDRQPSAPPGRRAYRRSPDTRRELADAPQTSAPGATVGSRRPLTISASHRSGQVKTCYAARDHAPCRWISYPCPPRDRLR